MKTGYIRYANVGLMVKTNKSWFKFLKKNKLRVKINEKITPLLEIGDLITFDDSDDIYKIIAIPKPRYGLKVFYLAYDLCDDKEDISCSVQYMEEHITSVLTHEIYNSKVFHIERKESDKNVKTIRKNGNGLRTRAKNKKTNNRQV